MSREHPIPNETKFTITNNVKLRVDPNNPDHLMDESAAPTPVPLEAREWLRSKGVEHEIRWEFSDPDHPVYLHELLESYSSHVNAALTQENNVLRHAVHDTNERLVVQRMRAEAAESRISELERERNEQHALFVAADSMLDDIGSMFNTTKPITKEMLDWLVSKTCDERPFSKLADDYHLLEYFTQKRLREAAESQLSTVREALQGLFDEFSTSGICDRGECMHRHCTNIWIAVDRAERVLAPPIDHLG